MAKLYTKKGDNGKTNLYDMRQLDKTHPIFDCLGDLDELSAHIGDLCAHIDEKWTEISKNLRHIQVLLLNIGSDIATMTYREKLEIITDKQVQLLENWIDHYQALTPKLTEFILPGVFVADSKAQICRTICRRAERNMWKIIQHIATGPETFKFINRLSDYFFILARYFSNGSEIIRSQAI